ncbi:MAG: hypothetical protein ACOCRK_03075 [bacterium]
MKDIFMFCGDSYDCRCDGYCCQECKRDKLEKYKSCDNRCDNIKFKEAVYRGEHDDKCIRLLENIAIDSDKWLAVVGIERFKEIKKQKEKLLNASKKILDNLDLMFDIEGRFIGGTDKLRKIVNEIENKN